MIGKNQMRCGEQQTGKTPPAQIRKHRFRAFTESERGILHVCALEKTASQQHQYHQSNAIGRRPEMQFDQRGITPFTSNQSRHDVVHRAENDHGEKCVETEMRISNADLAELRVARDRAERNQNADDTKDGV